jgi:two-component sensor histidine kinase
VHSGFGSVLLRRSIESQFGGSIVYDWRDDGLTIGICAPVSRIG